MLPLHPGPKNRYGDHHTKSGAYGRQSPDIVVKPKSTMIDK